MTIKERYLAEIKDILSLQFACASCSCIVAVPLTWKRNNIPLTCPTCDKQWIIANSPVNQSLLALVMAIRDVRAIEQSEAPFKLAVEITPPADSN